MSLFGVVLNNLKEGSTLEQWCFHSNMTQKIDYLGKEVIEKSEIMLYSYHFFCYGCQKTHTYVTKETYRFLKEKS